MNRHSLNVIFRLTFPVIMIGAALGFSSPNPASASGRQVGDFPAPAGGIAGFTSIKTGVPVPLYLDPLENPALPAPNASPDLIPIMGVNIHFIDNLAALDAAKSAGFSWVRTDLDWPTIERIPGRYNFSKYDRLMADLEGRGLRALFIFDYGNPRYTGGWDLPPTTADAMQAFGSFAEAAARHFAGHGVAYEIWNEPNVSRFWPPQPSPAQYATLASLVISRVHAGDPAAKVTTAGLSGADFTFLRSYLAQGGGAGADAIGLHPYGFDLPEAIAGMTAQWRTIVAGALPANPATWITEWGYSSTEYGDGHSLQAQDQQAVMAARELLTAWSAGFPLVIYYDLIDDGPNPNDPEQNYGLLAQDASPKPAMQAVRTLTSTARGRQLVGFISLPWPGLHAVELKGSSDRAAILWADAGQAIVSVPSGTTAVDLFGAPLALKPLGRQLSVPVRADSGPVYLFFPDN